MIKQLSLSIALLFTSSIALANNAVVLTQEDIQYCNDSLNQDLLAMERFNAKKRKTAKEYCLRQQIDLQMVKNNTPIITKDMETIISKYDTKNGEGKLSALTLEEINILHSWRADKLKSILLSSSKIENALAMHNITTQLQITMNSYWDTNENDNLTGDDIFAIRETVKNISDKAIKLRTKADNENTPSSVGKSILMSVESSQKMIAEIESVLIKITE